MHSELFFKNNTIPIKVSNKFYYGTDIIILKFISMFSNISLVFH